MQTSGVYLPNSREIEILNEIGLKNLVDTYCNSLKEKDFVGLKESSMSKKDLILREYEKTYAKGEEKVCFEEFVFKKIIKS